MTKKTDLIGFKTNLRKLYGPGINFLEDFNILNAIGFKYEVENQHLKLTEFVGGMIYSDLSQLVPLTGKTLNIPV